ncbi:MAG: Ribonucleotide reductase transcriptional regulator NrdR, partial [uncultured Gemmatimonadetes bacterium]
ALPVLPPRRRPRGRLAHQPRGPRRAPPAGVPALQPALHHVRVHRRAPADGAQARRRIGAVRPAQAAAEHPDRLRQAAHHPRRDRHAGGGDRAGAGPPRRGGGELRRAGADGDGAAPLARSRGVRAVRVRVPQLPGPGRVLAGAARPGGARGRDGGAPLPARAAAAAGRGNRSGGRGV